MIAEIAAALTILFSMNNGRSFECLAGPAGLYSLANDMKMNKPHVENNINLSSALGTFRIKSPLAAYRVTKTG